MYIVDVAYGVADEVDGQHNEHDNHARECAEPPCAGEEWPGVVEDRGPGRRQGRDTQSQEGEACLGQNRSGDKHACLDYDRWKCVGEDVLEHHPAIGRAHRPCRRYEVVLFEDKYHAPDDSGEVVHVCESDGDYYVLQAQPENGHQHYGQDEIGEGPKDVNRPHYDHIYPAAVVSGGYAQNYAYGRGERDGAKPDDHGYARADDDSAEQVSPNIIGSQRVRERGRFEQLVVLRLGVVRCYKLSKQGGQTEHNYDDESNHRASVTGETSREVFESAPGSGLFLQLCLDGTGTVFSQCIRLVGVSNARVYDRVEHVNKEVHEYEYECHQEDDALHNRIISAQDTFYK